MGTSKTNLFNDEQNNLAIIAKALAHPARIAIIQQTISKGSCINNDLVKELGLAQATTSQHLKELKNVGLIQGDIDENKMCYCINTENWNTAKNLLDNLFKSHSNNCNSNC